MCSSMFVVLSYFSLLVLLFLAYMFFFILFFLFFFLFAFFFFVFFYFIFFMFFFFFFFFQAEDGIRDVAVTGVQTCALPILLLILVCNNYQLLILNHKRQIEVIDTIKRNSYVNRLSELQSALYILKIGRASCRERV